MSLQEYTLGKLIYANPDTKRKIYIGLFRGNKEAMIKIEIHPTADNANLSVNESMALAALKHPNICQFYDVKLEPGPNNAYQTVIILERLQIDLAKEIRNRHSNRRFWPESELLDMLKTLAKTLEFAQTKGIAHRDIKPNNIFLSNSMVKIGDFGSALRLMDKGMIAKTPIGSLVYLSPELRQMFGLFIESPIPQRNEYDPFKSDVYSLGVTMVHLALLEPPNEISTVLVDPGICDIVLKKVTVRYPKLALVLRKMLAIDSKTRISFRDIKDVIEAEQSRPSRKMSEDLPTSRRSIERIDASMNVSIPSQIESGPDSREFSQDESDFSKSSMSFHSSQSKPLYAPYDQPQQNLILSQLYRSSTMPVIGEIGTERTNTTTTLCEVCESEIDLSTWNKLEALSSDGQVPDVCSEECYLKFTSNPEIEQVQCCICFKVLPVTSKFALTLQCGDFICQEKCLLEYCLRPQHKKSLIHGNWLCVKCGSTVQYGLKTNNEVIYFSGMLCESCCENPYEIVIPSCGHKCCKQCTKVFMIPVCLICSKRSS